ncbi:hypothetical protein PSEUBRA_005498 [Kalmanozyma brasiliensis GHG001]|uniref:Mediator of RNA polymerase II transcription subunit 5 n=1 Tax=Kalmanozyma brasiliensis (strain GHG001) TaxID=1365824 RepID=V5GGV1_KALBG|nr:uncharacterized protein PSEUBRA_005498 [Kalmanozyma brasiliensis GHG001]EST05232.1 hypothetical protein PSEUBRA_005498 [Kalmanozyma brasiliensis GHG001]
MSEGEAQQLIQKLLLQVLSRRLPQSKWLSLLHQLVRRIDASRQDAGGDDEDGMSLAGSQAAGCLVKQILSQSSIDPLLTEYLQALIYGSANRSGVEPDQGPVTDVITVTLHLLANVQIAAANVPAIETISSVTGQGLLMTFQGPAPFRISSPAFLHLLQSLFAGPSNAVAQLASSEALSKDGTIAPAALAFVVSNLRLLALAADPTIASPQNLLAPRVAITVLINVAQGLLAYTIQKLSVAQTSKDYKLKPHDDALRHTRSMSRSCVTEIEAVLQSMNPAWKDEIALLRSLTSQIGVVEQVSEALSEAATTSRTSTQARKRKAETWQDAQQRATWDHFLNVSSIAATEKPPVEPEMALLMHVLVDQHVAWERKLDAVKTLFLARRNAAAPSLTLEKSLTAYYFELLVAAIDACASIVEMPPAFKGAEVYAAIWRNALCGMVPEIVLQLEQWLDVQQDLPLRGQRLEAPHVRLEAALRAALLVMADRLNTCESATGQSHAQSSGAEEAAAMTDVLGLDTPPSQPIKAWLLRASIEHALARPEAIADEFPDGHKLASEVQSLTQSLRMDAQLEGLALSTLFETRVPSDDPHELLHRVASDPGTHFSFARQLVFQMQSWLEQHDLESIARWCKALSEDACEGGAVLDTVMLYIDPLEMLEPLASVLDHPELGQTSDEPSTLSNILLFAQLLCYRYAIHPSRISRYIPPNNDLDESQTSQDTAPPFLATHLATTSFCSPLATLSEDERALVGRWIHALFGNEGISDDLISLSPPTTLLRLSPLLFSQSISACQHGVIDLETLRGGLSYFLQDLLSFALPSALVWLLGEIVRTPQQPVLDFLAECGLQSTVVDVPSVDGALANGLKRNATSRTVGLEVLALLLDTEACPGVVREVIARDFHTFVQAVEGDAGLANGCETFELGALRARMEGKGVTAGLLSGAGRTWVRGKASGVGPLLATSGSSNVDRAVRTMGKTDAAEQKALAGWLCLVAPALKSVDTPLPAVLSFIQRLDFAKADEGAIESLVRVLGLVLGLIRAGEAQRSTPNNVASDLLAPSANEKAAEVVAAGGEGADLFDDEPTTPPLPSTGVPLNGATQAGTATAASTAATSISAALLIASPDFSITSRQLLDLIVLKLVRFKSAVQKGARGCTRAKWEVLESALMDHLSELSPVDEADGVAESRHSGLSAWLALLQ